MSPKARIQKRLYYKIGEACKVLDIQPYVLRYWETEFPAISPTKSRSGQRVYSERELEIIRRIKELLYDEGYTIAGAKKKLEAELASGGLEHGDESSGDEPPPAAIVEPPRETAPPAVERQAPSPAPAALDLGPAAAPLQVPLQLDTQGDERIQKLRSGVQRALQEARDILARLGS